MRGITPHFVTLLVIVPRHKNFIYRSRKSYANDKKKELCLNDALGLKLSFLVAKKSQKGGGKAEDSGELKK